ncbi:hypothetical protein TSAR_012459 [Trichomalopsis sarcophagae]|uniref:Uncharacterized protein n=1 Tax=Trichomalopsis sarcophagae TaxID=543379 RepID=A0A232FFS1_9HYME|nr:hypothetical protein TSAR_012459 [Trichomalopsis sarcophagae]
MFHIDYISTVDPFGDDPFAALHAPTRSDSPSPALPPKKTKLPPPRPAPPRPMQGPQLSSTSTVPGSAFVASHSDPFAEKAVSFHTDTTDSFEFADFANFDSKKFNDFNTLLFRYYERDYKIKHRYKL